MQATVAARTTDFETSTPRTRRVGSATAVTVLIDIVALEMALLLACCVRLCFRPISPINIAPAHFAGLAAGILLLPIMYYAIGLYPGYGIGVVERLRNRTYATVVTFIFLLGWNHIVQQSRWSRGILLLTMVFALIVPPLLNALISPLLVRRRICGVPAVILGAGKTGALVAKQLIGNPDLCLVPVAFLDDQPSRWGERIEGVPVLGPLSSVSDLRSDCSVAIVAIPSMPRRELMDLIHGVAFSNIIVVPDLIGMQTMWTATRDLGGIPGLEVRKNLLVTRNRIIKRLLDWAVAIPVFVASLPVIALSALLIRIVSPGPAFFAQEREGVGGRRIKVWKLRTMHRDAERILAEHLDRHPEERISWQRHFKLKRDPRVIPFIGGFLRRSSLDELPQLWNIIRGEMSLVGPRPFPFYHLDSFSGDFRMLRSSVLPGLTGMWQVSERSDGDLTIQEAHDTYYIRNWSLWLDIYILARTIQTVLVPRGAY